MAEKKSNLDEDEWLLLIASFIAGLTAALCWVLPTQPSQGATIFFGSVTVFFLAAFVFEPSGYSAVVATVLKVVVTFLQRLTWFWW